MKSEKLRKIEKINFDEMISVENLLAAWQEFERGKKSRKDVQIFSFNLMDNIFLLHRDLVNHTYQHGGYQAFKINDPKPRDIHKASVRDRLLHHAIYRILYPFFDKIFIADSYSCRIEKGTHRAVNQFRKFVYKVSKNNTRTCWILKCDIRKFFANIDHNILLKILRKYILDKNIIWLLEEIIRSFSTKEIQSSLDSRWSLPRSGLRGGNDKRGLPLGNLTSQLFVNIYMNEFDQFVKHNIKARRYVRYADDFVIFSENKEWLEQQIPAIKNFLWEKLRLKLHPDKVFIKTISSGMDFLGMVNFSNHRVLRTKTKKRMFRKIIARRRKVEEGLAIEKSLNQSSQFYLGILKHCRGHKIKKQIEKLVILRKT